ncbi:MULTISPECIES: hypothetical protein [unclassified Butyricimonas]|nr:MULTISPECIES: hypothetical protein [unclassified Butyricimonas]
MMRFSDGYFQYKMWSHFAKYLLGDLATPCFYDIDSSDERRIWKL